MLSPNLVKDFIMMIKIGLLITVLFTSSQVIAFSKKPVNTKFHIEFIEISAQTRTCQGIVEQQCLMYKKLTFKNGKKKYENNEWYNFYDDIEGFIHNKKNQVILKVRVYHVPSPPADGSNARYVLDKIIETKPIIQIQNES